MNAQDLLTDLSRRGIRLSTEHGYLCIDAPRGAIDDDLKRRLAAHKAALLALVGEPRTCATCTHGLGQDWPEKWARRYVDFPKRRAMLVYCGKLDWLMSPELDRLEDPCGHWTLKEDRP